ncbi:acyl-CoA thioesterase [Mycolicibacterium moriokaense]|uniref:Acyl-CoA thioesterase-2 n=1 Tax=Mycolicibacterium moriokaense TaxID=39691 RepID=A0A318H8N8_9MYCO|nr:acyl-CoA thioesterase domain-containing protein [Mycolicibacterium moriokaense]PXX02287.1 acyl-CoA thioesterase-2 [Mycolicibacterium moriokaense]
MPDLWSDLLACLDLRPVPSEGTGEERVGDDVTEFEGRNQQLDYRRVFGGQLLGQFIRIASVTCPDKAVKSQHAVFAREGRADEPVQYRATRHHEGRSFGTVTITARQSHGVIATSSVCVHVLEDGPERQSVDDVPAVLGPEYRVTIDMIPWEIRTTVDLSTDATGPPEFEAWMRTPTADPELAPALAAYATDLTLIGTALRPMDGVSQRGTTTVFTSAVTSHTIWFHRPFRTDDWLLLRQHSPLLANGRSFGRGDVLAEDGNLVASYAQEALLRFAS